MIFDSLLKMFKKKPSYPERAIYKPGDFVRFRYRAEVTHGFVYSAKEDEDGDISYTLQMGGECPSFAYNYKEKDIIGKID